MLKDNGKVKPRKSHKIRSYKCECGENVNIDERLELEDYDLVKKGQYVFYCPKCGNSSNIIKL